MAAFSPIVPLAKQTFAGQTAHRLPLTHSSRDYSFDQISTLTATTADVPTTATPFIPLRERRQHHRRHASWQT
ncbi:unnamed protein product [Zymoseptoria tritici ST99CH_3D7]|uniref:Uncharacterized protein n=1 Tax=Zymoseptoria tritici (strain ST99CH_3D7) TaxID=1276538 RepID=A0A1X7RN30_ZYMT9|nr:unnamed protein product [Zymoseptoria tritici ST99CH_3D7]